MGGWGWFCRGKESDFGKVKIKEVGGWETHDLNRLPGRDPFFSKRYSYETT